MTSWPIRTAVRSPRVRAVASAVRSLSVLPFLSIALASGMRAQDLGKIDFPTSGSPEAQEHFVRGVLYMHSFEYGDAARAFREAQRLDPDFAMAYWGEAMTHTHPVWNEQDREAARAVLSRLAPTAEARRAKARTPREKAYLDAIEVLYGEGTKAERDTLYSLAMADLVERYPDDLEAKAFYALSLLGLNQGVRDVADYMRAGAVAGEVFRTNPQHPGAAHYVIHAFDDPVHAPLGLAAARAYITIAPDAPHAQHMTTHIFVALGMWDEVVSQNEIATGQRWSPHHYTFWLVYGLLQQGRYADARDLIERVSGRAGARMQRSVLVAMRGHYWVHTSEREDPIADLQIELGDLSADTRARHRLVEGLRALQRGDRASAESALAALTALPRNLSGPPEERVPAIVELELRAAIEHAKGNAASALALLREATALEDAMPFEFGPPVVVKPTHELLGEILLDLGRAQEAQQQFERALELAPKRALSLLGLGRAARAAGDERTAKRAYETLRQVWHRADPGIPGLDEARRFAAVGE